MWMRKLKRLRREEHPDTVRVRCGCGALDPEHPYVRDTGNRIAVNILQRGWRRMNYTGLAVCPDCAETTHPNRMIGGFFNGKRHHFGAEPTAPAEVR